MSIRGTLGVLVEGELPLCVTLEDPWLDNERGKSCIPFGYYRCERVMSPNFGDTFTITNVPNRSLIRFHVGNHTGHTSGCVLLGTFFDTVDGRPWIKDSRRSFEDFMSHMGDTEEFILKIYESKP